MINWKFVAYEFPTSSKPKIPVRSGFSLLVTAAILRSFALKCRTTATAIGTLRIQREPDSSPAVHITADLSV